jgi:hypothetical protein
MTRGKIKEKGKGKIGGNKEGNKKRYSGHFTLLSILHSHEKLFCQMFY